MPIKHSTVRWRPQSSAAIRTRLPGDVSPEVIGEQARDADQAVSGIPRLQLVEVNNQTWSSPFGVAFEARPRMILVNCTRADDQDALVGVAGTCDWRWENGSAQIRNIAFLPFSNTNKYNFIFLGVG